MRLLGIDYGAVRIGLAVSDVTGTLARPLRTVVVRGSPETQASELGIEVAHIKTEFEDLGALVVGLPASLEGGPDASTESVLAFVEALRVSTALPIALQDERLSSVEAEQRLALREPNWRKRKSRLDAASAAVILKDYLDRTTNNKAGSTVDD